MNFFKKDKYQVQTPVKSKQKLTISAGVAKSYLTVFYFSFYYPTSTTQNMSICDLVVQLNAPCLLSCGAFLSSLASVQLGFFLFLKLLTRLIFHLMQTEKESQLNGLTKSELCSVFCMASNCSLIKQSVCMLPMFHMHFLKKASLSFHHLQVTTETRSFICNCLSQE